jgi:predicted O-methyltransferase YrrM
MNILELHERVLNSPFPPYDSRLSPFMDERGYEAYKSNTGHTYYLYLARLVRELAPKRLVELGTDIGRAAAFMMTQLPARSEFITVEIGSQPRTDLAACHGDPRLKIVTGSSTDPSVYEPLQDIDLLFIDTDHRYEQVSAEWQIYRGRLSKGAVVVFDDIHLNPGMEQFWAELPEPKVDAGKDIHFSGWGMFSVPG